MKTTSTIVVFIAMFILSVGTSKAAYPDVLQQVKNEISYPEFAKKQSLEGMVLISFYVTEDGSIQIIESNTNCTELADYVITKLSEIKIKTEYCNNDKTYNIRFVFKRS